MKKATVTFYTPDHVDEQCVRDYLDHITAVNTVAEIEIEQPILKTYEWDNFDSNCQYRFWLQDASNEEECAQRLAGKHSTVHFMGTLAVHEQGTRPFHVYSTSGSSLLIVREKQEGSF